MTDPARCADLSNAEGPRQISSRYGIEVEVGVSKNVLTFQDFLFLSTRYMNELSCEALILIPFLRKADIAWHIDSIKGLFNWIAILLSTLYNFIELKKVI